MARSPAHSRGAAARTMDDLQEPQPSWGAEIRNYETVKRHVLDEGFLRGPQARVTNGAMKRAERVFDPLLQRYRSGGTELEQRVLEETERVNHLNRAQDIAIMREQPFDIIRHESKLDAIAPGVDPTRFGNPRRAEGQPGNALPDTTLDYNLISNMPFDSHHWARPELRPRCVERTAPRQRSVPQYQVKDFNIVTNRYSRQHEAKSKRDSRANLLEATYKDAVQNRYDPVTQQFNDPHKEEFFRTCDDAHGVEMQMRATAQQPPSMKGRETEFYNMVTHEKHDDGMLKFYDKAEAGRKDRYNNRYIMEHNWHAQDIKGDHVNNTRKLNRAAPERFEEEAQRGYDIVSHRSHGHGTKSQTLYAPFSQARLTPWEQAHTGSRPRSHSGISGMDGARSEAGGSRRSHSSHGGHNRTSVYSGRAG